MDDSMTHPFPSHQLISSSHPLFSNNFLISHSYHLDMFRVPSFRVPFCVVFRWGAQQTAFSSKPGDKKESWEMHCCTIHFSGLYRKILTNYINIIYYLTTHILISLYLYDFMIFHVWWRKDLDATPANSIASSAFDIPPTAPWWDAKNDMTQRSESQIEQILRSP